MKCVKDDFMIQDHSVYVAYGDSPADLIHTLFDETAKSDKISPAELFSPNENVVIKPNVEILKESSTGATTDPSLVEQVIIELMKLKVKKITIAEGAELKIDTAKAFKFCDYEKLCTKYNVNLVDLKQDKFVPVKVPGNYSKLKDIRIAETILKADKIINIPVLKAHSQTGLSCGMKNLMGIISESEKSNFYHSGLDNSIFELNTVIKTTLNIGDAIVGDAYSEEGIAPVRFRKIFMSQDLFAFDYYAAASLGLDIREIGYLKAYKEYLGFSGQPKIVELNKAPAELENPDALINKRFQSKLFSNKAICSQCLSSVIEVLEKGYDKATQEFYIGLKAAPEIITPFVNSIFVGNCSKKNSSTEGFVPGCPPHASDLIKWIKSFKN
jgi:uncharacterized protein (DUF362 family)